MVVICFHNNGSYNVQLQHTNGFLNMIHQSLIKFSFTLIIGTHSQQNLNFTHSHIVKLLKLYSQTGIKTFQQVESSFSITQFQSLQSQNMSSGKTDWHWEQKLYSHQQCINFNISVIVLY